MENAVDALKMAGSVLLFVIALSVAIPAFTNVRITMDSVLGQTDRESLTIEGDSRFYYLPTDNKNNTNRYVGKETIIPTLYRAYKENYKVEFNFTEDYYLYKKKVGSETKEIKEIDLLGQSISSDKQSRQFLNGIIYGFPLNSDNDENLTFDNWKKKFNVEPNNKSLYEYLTDMEKRNIIIKEELGTYYMNDVINENGTTTGINGNDSSGTTLTDNNKTEKRIITYTFQSK